MSSALYDVRLYWDAEQGSGCAKARGVQRRFTTFPQHLGLPSQTALIDYAPETDTALIRPSDKEEVRAMSKVEVAAAQYFLDVLEHPVHEI